MLNKAFCDDDLEASDIINNMEGHLAYTDNYTHNNDDEFIMMNDVIKELNLDTWISENLLNEYSKKLIYLTDQFNLHSQIFRNVTKNLHDVAWDMITTQEQKEEIASLMFLT